MIKRGCFMKKLIIKISLLVNFLGLTLNAGVPEEEVLILTKSEVIRMPKVKMLQLLMK